jgi:hypothetical protein
MYVLDNSVFYGNLSANSISIGSGNLSLNNLNSTNITGISATIHGNLSANTLSISSGNLSITNLNSTNITGTSATIHGNLSANTLSISSGNLSITNLNSTNITGTSITTGNLSTINANINSITSSLITNSNLICANIIGDTVFYGNQINKQAITLNGYEPSIKANTLYNKFGNIYWNDRQLDITNNSTAITSNIILDNGTYKWKFEIDASNGDMVFYKFNGNTYIEKQRIG